MTAGLYDLLVELILSDRNGLVCCACAAALRTAGLLLLAVVRPLVLAHPPVLDGGQLLVRLLDLHEPAGLKFTICQSGIL